MNVKAAINMDETMSAIQSDLEGSWPELTAPIYVPLPGRAADWPPAAMLHALISESCARAIVRRVWRRRAVSAR